MASRSQRRRWALQGYTTQTLNVSEADRDRLLGLLSEGTNEGELALEAVAARCSPADLLAACWSILRAPDHRLARSASDRVRHLASVTSDRAVLAVLDEGLGEEALRPYALDLVRRCVTNEHTFAQILLWLCHGKSAVRHVAALLLSAYDDLRVQPLIAACAPPETTGDDAATWRAASEDGAVVRLLSELCLHGWDEALTQLLMRSADIEFYPRLSSDRDANDVEEWVVDRLRNAGFGASLAGLLREAAGDLACREGKQPHVRADAGAISASQASIKCALLDLFADPQTPAQTQADVLRFLGFADRDAFDALVATRTQETMTATRPDKWILTIASLVGSGMVSRITRIPQL